MLKTQNEANIKLKYMLNKGGGEGGRETASEDVPYSSTVNGDIACLIYILIWFYLQFNF